MGLREYVIDLVGTHESTLYGPSDGKLLPSSVLAGRYLSDSTGAAEKAGSVSMSTKYDACWVRWKTTVVSSLASTPGNGVLSMYSWIPATVFGALAKPSANAL